jgi:3-oxoacyl-(acyl-carrier-protein) synthase
MTSAVAITGIGALSAAGDGLAALEAALIAGRPGLERGTDPALPLAQLLPVGAVQTGLPAHEPRTVALALHAGAAALADAGHPDPTDIGLALGSCTGGLRGGEAVYLDHGPQAVGPGYRHQPVGRSAVRIAQRLRLRGPLTAHAEACASAANALAEALLWIRAGLAAQVLVIGADALTRLTMAGFHSLRIVDPDGCRPFTHERAGMSLGEGACAFVLEDPRHARRRNARIHACVLGCGLTADAHHATAPDPSGRWLEQAIRTALAEAQVEPAGIGFIAAHGTATRDNDGHEAATLNRLFGQVPAASHKRCLGHTLGAAAAFGVAAAALSVRAGVLLPNRAPPGATGLADLDLADVARARAPGLALTTCLAFGGVNAACVIGGAERC